MQTKKLKKTDGNNKSSGHIHHDHPRPVTRRQLMAQGLLGCSGALLAPGILDILSGRAYAAPANCSSASTGASQIPVLIFDLVGGGNIAGSNVIVGGKGGQMDFLGSGQYKTLGLVGAKEPSQVTPNTDCGLAFHADSDMLAGIKMHASKATLDAVDGTLYCSISADDTQNNPFSPIYWLARGGLAGSLVPIIGSTAGDTGGNSAAPRESVDPGKAPTLIKSPSDSRSLVDPGRLAVLLGSAAQPDKRAVQKVMAAINKMSEAQLAKFKSQDLPSQVRELVQCGYLNSSEYFDKFNPSNLDPSADTDITRLYAGLASDDEQKKAGTITKLVVEGYAGAGVISLPEFDYHNRGRAFQATRDQIAGEMIGRALEYAAIKRKSLMIYVYTDGGVLSDPNQSLQQGQSFLEFTSDNGERSASMVLVYNAAGKRPELRRSNVRQIGAYNRTGAVDSGSSLISNNVDLLTKAVFANWLALHGREADYDRIVGKNEFGSDFDKYLTFTKIAG